MYSPFISIQDFVTDLHNAYTNNSRKEKEIIHNRLMFTPLALAHRCLILLKETCDMSSVYMNMANSIPQGKSKTDYYNRYVRLMFYPERNQELTPSLLNEFTGEIENSITIESYVYFLKSLKDECENEMTKLQEIRELFMDTCKTESEFVDMIGS